MGRVVHFEIHCGDLDRAERFYRDVFGWEIQRYEGAPVDYRLVTTGPDGEIGINGALVERRGEIDGQAVIA
jgi:predicted enzyme related to lactoylglutathione lyase